MDDKVIIDYVDNMIDEINSLNIDGCKVEKNLYFILNTTFVKIILDESKVSFEQITPVKDILNNHLFVLSYEEVEGIYNTYSYICYNTYLKEHIREQSLKELLK